MNRRTKLKERRKRAFEILEKDPSLTYIVLSERLGISRGNASDIKSEFLKLKKENNK